MGHVKKSADHLQKLQAEIEEFLRESLGDMKHRDTEQTHTPSIDVYESGDNLCIDVDLPGLRKDEIVLSVSSDKVFIEARKKPSRPEKTAHYFCMERLFGRFAREIEIPVIVNTTLATASFAEGMLKIKIPKITDRRQKKRRVEIA